MAKSEPNCQCYVRKVAATTRATDYLHGHKPPALVSSCTILTIVEDMLRQCGQCTCCGPDKSGDALLEIIALEQATCILEALQEETSAELSHSSGPSNRLMTVPAGAYVDQTITVRSVELAFLRKHASVLLQMATGLATSLPPADGECQIGSNGEIYAANLRGLLVVTRGRLVAIATRCEQVPLPIATADP